MRPLATTRSQQPVAEWTRRAHDCDRERMTEFLVIGLTAAILLLLWKSRWNYRHLPELSQKTGTQPLDLTVIIPARNEAHQIARAVQSFRGLPIIVVDDDSSDDTARLARDAGATVITAPHLTPGAKGKPNACFAGAQQAQTKWIVFVDADTWFEPTFAASIVSYASEQNLQVVTVFLHQHCETIAEKLVLPYAFALYFCGVSARNVNSTKSSEALVNGQCLLFERLAYNTISGNASVGQSVIEDVALAAEARRRGLRLRVIRAEKLGHVRMYDSMAAIWRGFQKNSFRFLTINLRSGVQVVLASILLTSWLPVLILGLQDLPAPSAIIHSPVILLLAAPFIGLLPWYRRWVFLSPVAIYLFQLIALNGMIAAIFHPKTNCKERAV